MLRARIAINDVAASDLLEAQTAKDMVRRALLEDGRMNISFSYTGEREPTIQFWCCDGRLVLDSPLDAELDECIADINGDVAEGRMLLGVLEAAADKLRAHLAEYGEA